MFAKLVILLCRLKTGKVCSEVFSSHDREKTARTGHKMGKEKIEAEILEIFSTEAAFIISENRESSLFSFLSGSPLCPLSRIRYPITLTNPRALSN